MKRVIMILAAVLLVAGLSVPTLAQDQEPSTSSTTVTVSVLADINEQISLEYSPDYPDNPIYPGPPGGGHEPDDPWVMGTLIPQRAVYGAPEGASTMVRGYLWAYKYQSNGFTRCVVSHEPVSDEIPSLGDVLHPFLWQKKWARTDFGPRFHPTTDNNWESDPIDPSYGSAWDIPNMVEFNMGQPGDGHEGISPWSIPAGDYMSRVITQWWVRPEDGSYPEDPLWTRDGYLKVVVAPVFSYSLNFGISESEGSLPEPGFYADLVVGENWKGEIYPYILNFQSNAVSWNRLTVGPITLNGASDGADIRPYMTHYPWTGLALGDGINMSPNCGNNYVYFDDSCEASGTNEWDILNKVTIDLSDDGCDGDGADRWKVQAGDYTFVDEAYGMKLEFGFGENTSSPVVTFSLGKDDAEVRVPRKQAGYELQGGKFVGEEGQAEVKPGQTATYSERLTTYQNHNRDVWFTCSWKDKTSGQLDWAFTPLSNVREDTEGEPGDEVMWRGVFEYNPEGSASVLDYQVTYTPGWADVPGPKSLTITLNHTPKLP
ncbi:MAG: hypothetical protein QME82_01980 [Bacillota bacterium]|nr:hypothetical protein [Bacillota bacterium]